MFLSLVSSRLVSSRNQIKLPSEYQRTMIQASNQKFMEEGRERGEERRKNCLKVLWRWELFLKHTSSPPRAKSRSNMLGCIVPNFWVGWGSGRGACVSSSSSSRRTTTRYGTLVERGQDSFLEKFQYMNILSE